MMRILAALIISLFASPALAQSVSCPNYIDVAPQKLRTDMPGWKPFYDVYHLRYTLNQVSVYNGDPSLLAALAPDANSASYADYNLYDNGREKYFLACGYSNTSIQLYQQLSKELRRCRVTYQRVYNPSGTPLPYTVTCD
jgi:hypothetical protein